MRLEQILVALFAAGLLYSLRMPLLFRPLANAVANEVERRELSVDSIRRRLFTEDTIRFIEQEMPATQRYKTRNELLAKSISAVTVNGLYCEFGVYTGGTINVIADLRPDATIHGFDSFEGLPESWRDGFGKGAFAINGLPPVRKNVILHKGWFDQVLPRWKAEHLGPVAFLHMDADLYSSTKTVLDILADRIVPGTVIQFDELIAYPGFQYNGELKAWREFSAAHRVRFEYIGYAWESGQVALRIR